MKRFIVILALVCTVFIVCGSVGYAYDSKDSVPSAHIQSMVNYLSSRAGDGYEVVVYFSGSQLCGHIYNCSYIYSSGSLTLFNCNTRYFTNDGVNFDYATTGSNANYFAVSKIFYSTATFYDDNGNVVFPQTPPVEVPEVTQPGLEGITAELLLGVLLELKPILLGLAVSVIGFLAFRKVWKWVLIQLHLG